MINFEKKEFGTITVGYLKTQGGGAVIGKTVKNTFSLAVWEQNKVMNYDGKRKNQNQGDCATTVEEFLKMMIKAGF